MRQRQIKIKKTQILLYLVRKKGATDAIARTDRQRYFNE